MASDTGKPTPDDDSLDPGQPYDPASPIDPDSPHRFEPGQPQMPRGFPDEKRQPPDVGPDESGMQNPASQFDGLE